MNTVDTNETLEEYIIARRRHFHQNPELSFQEFETTKTLAAELETFGIETETFPDYNGVMGTLHGKAPGKTVILRADIDALPVQEYTGVSYQSCNQNMHACGHDCHMAMLLGAARFLSENRNLITGTVKFLFQSAEESTYGAKYYIEKNLLDDGDAIMGMHIWSGLEAHKMSIEMGPRMASCDNFTITVSGTGSHACTPHMGKDAIIAAAAILMNLQTYVSRNIDPVNPLVVSVGTIQGGQRFNIIADKVVMEGTVRTFSREQRAKNEEDLRRMITNSAAALGCQAALDYRYGPGAVINEHETLVRIAQDAAVSLFGEEILTKYTHQMVSEDFSYYSDRIPSLFIFLGCRNEMVGADYPHHSNKFNVDEGVLIKGMKLYAQFAFDFLASTKRLEV